MWSFEHSVECKVERDFACRRYSCDVRFFLECGGLAAAFTGDVQTQML